MAIVKIPVEVSVAVSWVNREIGLLLILVPREKRCRGLPTQCTFNGLGLLETRACGLVGNIGKVRPQYA